MATFGLCLAVIAMPVLDLAHAWDTARIGGRFEGDEAVLALAVIDAFDGEAPRGAYSRFGWHHVGPLLIQQLELGLWLGGRQSFVLVWTAALCNMICLVLGVAILARERSTLAAVLLLATFLSYAALGDYTWPALVLRMWNPLVALLPMFLLSCLAWSRRSRFFALPLVVFLHAYIVQAHIGFAGVASVIAMVAASRCVRGWRFHSKAKIVAVSVATVAAGGLAWWSLSYTWPNVVRVASFLVERPHGGLELRDALFVTVRRTQEGVLLLADAELPSRPFAIALLGAQLLITAAHAGWRLSRREGVPWSIVILSFGCLALAASSSFMVDVPSNTHQTHWFVWVGTFAWVGALWPWLGRRLPLVGWAVIAIVVGVTLIAYDGGSRRRRAEWVELSTHLGMKGGALADMIEPLAEEAPIRLHVLPQDHDLWGTAAGLAVVMDGRGHRVAIDPRFEFMFGEGRTRCAPGCRPIWLSFSPDREGFHVIGSAYDVFLIEPDPGTSLAVTPR